MKRLPIGNDEFREIREKDYYYIDKTMLISDFLEVGDKVTLIANVPISEARPCFPMHGAATA